jgi:hypothetical protein
MRTGTTARCASLALLAALAAGAVALCAPARSLAAPAPIKEVLTGQFDNGFEYPSVAVDNDPASQEYSDVYVLDSGNHRVQVLSASGVFIEMFGWEVNATKDGEPLATQAEKNVCTAESKDQCQAGVSGSAAGQFAEPETIAADPVSSDVYVAELVRTGEVSGDRVQEFTAAGQFKLELGREVNRTKKTNVCSAKEVEKAGVECAGPEPVVPGSGEDGAFNFETGKLILAAGGTADLLYVGDEHRVQEFGAEGEWVGEISLNAISAEAGSKVNVLALDQETGNLYLVYPQESTLVRELSSEGSEVASIPASPGATGVVGLAVSPAGQLAVVAGGHQNGAFTGLYDAVDGRRVSSFAIPVAGIEVKNIAFNSADDLYVAVSNQSGESQVLAYTAQPIAELTVGAAACAPTLGAEASVVFDCTLHGEVNPEGVAQTEALFDWGTTPALGETTAAQAVTAPEEVHAVVGVPPNATLHFQLAGHDENAKAPEQLESEQASTPTPPVPPRILSVSASHPSSSAADLFAELNPENTSTTYEFQYAPACATGEPCPPIAQAPGMVQTPGESSAQYSKVGVTAEASGLAPASSYRYRLVAVNEQGEAALDEAGGATLPEGTFTTAAAPTPNASTGAASAVGSSSAVVSGTVEPDGAPATYSFELGVYEGAATQYGIVFSGPAGAGTAPLEESLALSGLEPGTTYAYRIAITSGYIDNGERTLRGAPALFTTAGLPAVLTAPVAPSLLALPSIAFPKVTGGASGGTKGKTKHKHKHKGKSKGRSKRAGKRKGARKHGR